MAQTYCTAADVYFVLSEAGATACVDDLETGTLSAAGQALITSAIEIAAGDINQAVRHQYKLSDLSGGNYWLKWTNAYFAAAKLAVRRSNPAPESLDAEVKSRKDTLLEIRWGRESIPEQNPSFDFRPTMSNLTVEPGKISNPVRVIVDESTGGAPVDGIRRHVAGDGSYR